MSGARDDEGRREPRERSRPADPEPGPGHVSADLERVASNEDDPDAGSGRADADDGAYLAGEGTGRPY